MDLKTYKFIHDTTYTAMAEKVGITQNYMIYIANKTMICGATMAIKIEKALNCEVPRSELRPDLWPPESEPFDLKKLIDK